MLFPPLGTDFRVQFQAPVEGGRLRKKNAGKWRMQFFKKSSVWPDFSGVICVNNSDHPWPKSAF
jgi:hypothetical protein